MVEKDRPERRILRKRPESWQMIRVAAAEAASADAGVRGLVVADQGRVLPAAAATAAVAAQHARPRPRRLSPRVHPAVAAAAAAAAGSPGAAAGPIVAHRPVRLVRPAAAAAASAAAAAAAAAAAGVRGARRGLVVAHLRRILGGKAALRGWRA